MKFRDILNYKIRVMPYLIFTRKIILFLFCFILIFSAWANCVQAGFGISPPHIKNSQLVPGSHFEQTITLLRSSAEEDLKAKIKINAPDIESWLTIDQGKEFILPKGSFQIPMDVNIDVPQNAELGNYNGYININIAPVEEKEGGGVAVALGARIDIDLSLTNVTYADFIVRLASIPDFELMGWPWNWKIFSKFLQKVRVVMTLENIGNVKTAPSKVTLEILDITKKNILESSTDKSLKKIDPFSTGEVIAAFPTELNAGQYWGRIKVYKGNEIVNFYEIAFTIAAKGELPEGAPDLGLLPWALLLVYILGLAIIIYILIKIRIWKILFNLVSFILLIIFKPIKPLLDKFVLLLKKLKIKFWEWVSKKAERYNKKEE